MLRNTHFGQPSDNLTSLGGAEDLTLIQKGSMPLEWSVTTLELFRQQSNNNSVVFPGDLSIDGK
jgi:hypothetical protein